MYNYLKRYFDKYVIWRKFIRHIQKKTVEEMKIMNAKEKSLMIYFYSFKMTFFFLSYTILPKWQFLCYFSLVRINYHFIG